MKKILVVDDFSSVRLYHCNLIKHMGHSPLEAGSITDARNILSRENVDLVLLDLLMPDEDGRSLLDGSRSSGKSLPPIIVITSESEQYGAQGLSNLPVRKVLTKPVMPQSLESAITSALV